MSTPAAPPAPAADRDPLSSLLADPRWEGRALGVDAVQGLFCALAIGPDESVPDDVWLPVVLGVETLDPESVPPALREGLAAFADATAEALRAGTFHPALRELRRGRLDYASWCRGFLDGVEVSPAGWFESADPDEVDELLFPILVAGDALAADEKRAYKPAEWRKLLLESESRLEEAIGRMRGYWAIVRNPVETIRREGAKVGRNDPCPCGSGRKFKQCHGR